MSTLLGLEKQAVFVEQINMTVPTEPLIFVRPKLEKIIYSISITVIRRMLKKYGLNTKLWCGHQF
jgi:hypothetical protein